MAGDVRFYRNSLKLLDASERELNAKSLILIGKPNMTYVTGMREPSGAVIISSECGNHVIVPLLDYHRALNSAPREYSVKAFHRKGEESLRLDIPSSDLITGGLVDAISRVLEGCGTAGLDMDWVDYPLASSLKESLKGLVDASKIVRRARSIKEDWEVEMIEAAARIAEEGLRRLIDSLDQGVDESSLAGLLAKTYLEMGAWSEAFPSIVAFYQNTAIPHHTPTKLRLAHPGPVLVDTGAVASGYHSDMTRTWWWGGSPGDEFSRAFESVLEAQLSSIDEVGPGVEAWEPDRTARRVLEKRGLASRFIHGLGHGVGLEIHEAPYLRPGSEDKLEPGMVVTVEPGIYIPGAYGIRIEDLVLVTKKGRRVITGFSRVIS